MDLGGDSIEPIGASIAINTVTPIGSPPLIGGQWRFISWPLGSWPSIPCTSAQDNWPQEGKFLAPSASPAQPQLCSSSCQHQNKPDIEIQSHSLLDAQRCAGLSLLIRYRQSSMEGGRGREDESGREVKMRNTCGITYFQISISRKPTWVSGHAQRAARSLPCPCLEIKVLFS